MENITDCVKSGVVMQGKSAPIVCEYCGRRNWVMWVWSVQNGKTGAMYDKPAHKACLERNYINNQPKNSIIWDLY